MTVSADHSHSTSVRRFLLGIDRLSAWSGKAFAWLIVILAFVVGGEVFKRYILNAPTSWIFDANNMLYGTLFMMSGAYALAQNAHVRGDFLYGSMRPRVQAGLDLTLYVLFFIPGVLALMYAGYHFASLSLQINEHSNVTSDGPPVYQFKAVIPVAGLLVMIQGVAEIVRCIVCLRTGQWPARLKDVEEIDVVGEQLSQSEFVDEDARKAAIEQAHEIHEAAVQRGMGDAGKVENVSLPGDRK